MWSAWWAWALAALVLAAIEVVTPVYIALGFAIGAGLVSVGLLTGTLSILTGLAGGYAPAALFALFAVLSLVAWIVLRAVFGDPRGSVQTFEDDVND